MLLQFQTISKRLSPEGECKVSGDTLSSQGSKRWQSQSSKDSSQNRKMMSPMTNDAPSVKSKRSRARKESKHYQVRGEKIGILRSTSKFICNSFQESDILESPQVYCRSNLGDKISDYEDLWTSENGNEQGLSKGPLMSSFRPENAHSKRPDLLPETRKNFIIVHSTQLISTASFFFLLSSDSQIVE